MNQAVKTTIADERDGKWRSGPCFQFARQLKAHPELGHLEAPKLLQQVEREMGTVFWETFGLSRDDSHAEILGCWEQIRRLPGLDALDNAAVYARRRTLSFDAAFTKQFERRGRSKKYQEFMSLCGWLQVIVGPGEPIALPCARIADILTGVTPMTVCRYRKWLVEDGLLSAVSAHKFHGPAASNNRATTFTFRYGHWPILVKFAEGRSDE
jgi:hypothetical protein